MCHFMNMFISNFTIFSVSEIILFPPAVLDFFFSKYKEQEIPKANDISYDMFCLRYFLLSGIVWHRVCDS